MEAVPPALYLNDLAGCHGVPSPQSDLHVVRQFDMIAGPQLAEDVKRLFLLGRHG
jgi:hypothetical protein